jgi:hypothetical protein
MHYNESTDKMIKEKKISKPEVSYILNATSYFINICVIIIMFLFFLMKEALD